MPGSNHSTERFGRCFSASALGVLLALALFSLWPARSLADRGMPDSSAASKPAAARQAAPARPEVLLDAVRRDYGDVFAGEILDSPFNIFNAGKAPLEMMQRSLTSRASSLSLGSGRVDSRSERYSLVPVAARLAAPS
ncbi:MAG: hypothetical protein AABO41_20000 [Acidobacteriota bacterium]